MNIILNTPLPSTFATKQDYDNKVLYIFLVMLASLIIAGVFFVDLTNRSTLI